MDRVDDFADIVGAELYRGKGFLANTRGTKLVPAGIGGFDGNIASYDHRASCIVQRASCSVHRAMGVATEARAEGGLPFYCFAACDRRSENGNEAFRQRVASVESPGVVKHDLNDSQGRSFYRAGGSL